MKKPRGKPRSNPIHNNPNQKKTSKYDFESDFKMPPQDSEKWYSSLPQDPDIVSDCSIDTINKLKEEARLMLETEANGHNIKASKNSEQSWIRSVMAKGTGKDKMAAYTLMIQEKPMYNLNALRSLSGLVKPGKKENIACIDLLVELFTSELLPPNTKLKRFSQHPLTMLEELSSGNPAGRRRRLVTWYFEDQLKEIYKDFVDAMRIIAAEAVEASKEKAIKAMATLLESHPEQEVALLSNLVNKMGDPSKKVSSKAMLCLTQVLQKHPNMKGVMMDEVEKLLFRPNIGHKARYYGVCFLSQIMFHKADAQLAANIIKIYFSFFKACVKLGDVDSKMLSALLTGVNRAYPYARDAMDSIAEQLETLYKIVHMAPFHVGLQGLSLLFQVADYKNNVSDRFYSVLYRKLLDPALAQTSHAPMFLNLTFQALKKDESIPRVRAFIKRLLQVCCHLSVPMICAILYMVSQLVQQRSALLANTVGAGLKLEAGEVKIEQVQTLPAVFLEDDSEDEHYEDVPLEEDDAKSTKSEKNKNGTEKVPAAWVHTKEEPKRIKSDTYDPRERNPLYANGEMCSYTELCYLSSHFHPTVALFASDILNNKLITYTGDPLKDFTLIRFLERFSFKNPKKHSDHSSSSLFAKRNAYSVKGARGMAVTSNAYLNQEEEKVPVEERFLFNFLQRRRRVEEDGHKRKDDDSDVESVASDEFEEMLEDLMKKKGFKKDYDEEDDDLDFADEYSKNMTSKKNQRKDEEDEDNMSDIGEGGDSEDDDLEGEDLEEDEDLDDADDLGEGDELGEENEAGDEEDDDDMDDIDFDNLDDDAEDMDFDADSEDEIAPVGKTKGKKSRKGGLNSDIFASAEEFSELLEAAGAAREGTLSAVSNKDKASHKQLNWEAERDRWVKGYKNFTKGGGKLPGATRKKGKPGGVKKTTFKPKRSKRP